nr:MAG TPA: hypothetical protein [Bacteriophage sp.]
MCKQRGRKTSICKHSNKCKCKRCKHRVNNTKFTHNTA